MLDGIELPSNYGAILRLAEAANIEKVIPYKMSNFLGHPKAKQAARSVEKQLIIEPIDDLAALKTALNGYSLVALEWTNSSIEYHQYSTSPSLALVLGNEKHGVSEELLAASTASVHLPMHGLNTSMNVAMAAGIVVYSWLVK